MGIQDRREREKEQRRQQIIVAVRRVLQKKGFTKATIEDIAKEAELCYSTLYIYFKSKEVLYATLSLQILYYMNMRISHVMNQSDLSKMKKLYMLQDVLLDVYNFDPLVAINMFHLQSSQALKNLPESLLDEINNLTRDFTMTIARFFKQGIEAGLFINRHPAAMADIFGALFSGIVLWETSKTIINDKRNHLKSTHRIAYEIFRRDIST